MDGYQDREAAGVGLWGRASTGQGVFSEEHLYPGPMKLGRRREDTRVSWSLV